MDSRFRYWFLHALLLNQHLRIFTEVLVCVILISALVIGCSAPLWQSARIQLFVPGEEQFRKGNFYIDTNREGAVEALESSIAKMREFIKIAENEPEAEADVQEAKSYIARAYLAIGKWYVREARERKDLTTQDRLNLLNKAVERMEESQKHHTSNDVSQSIMTAQRVIRDIEAFESAKSKCERMDVERDVGKVVTEGSSLSRCMQEYESVLNALQRIEAQSFLKNELQETIKKLERDLSTLRDVESKIIASRERFDIAMRYYNRENFLDALKEFRFVDEVYTPKEYEDSKKKINEIEEGIRSSMKHYNEGLGYYNDKMLPLALTEFKLVVRAYTPGEYEDAREKIDEIEDGMEDSLKHYNDGLSFYNDGLFLSALEEFNQVARNYTPKEYEDATQKKNEIDENIRISKQHFEMGTKYFDSKDFSTGTGELSEVKNAFTPDESAQAQAMIDARNEALQHLKNIDKHIGTGENSKALAEFSQLNRKYTTDQEYEEASAKVMNNGEEHHITATAGRYGSISPSGRVSIQNGTDQTFSMRADTGYHVQSVLVDGNSVGQVNTYTFRNIRDDHTIFATFAQNVPSPPVEPTHHTITAVAEGHGSISPSGSVLVERGASETFTIKPAQGYRVSNVWVNGISVGARTTYVFKNVKADGSIRATFRSEDGIIELRPFAHDDVKVDQQVDRGSIEVNEIRRYSIRIEKFGDMEILVPGGYVVEAQGFDFKGIKEFEDGRKFKRFFREETGKGTSVLAKIAREQNSPDNYEFIFSLYPR